MPLEKLTPVWQSGATPIELLDIFINAIGNAKNAPIKRQFQAGDPPEAVLLFSIPPQAPVGILSHIALLSATTSIEGTRRAFDKQSVTITEHEGGELEWADGVLVFQFADARITAASVFKYPTDTNGKRKLQEPPTALTATAEKRLQKLNAWAKQVDGLTAFISYKEFTQGKFAEAVNDFDIVTHFDKVAGLNFDGLKYLVVFGYPKVKHDVIIEQAIKQYASDSTPLPKGSYDELTETADFQEEGLTITERRYKDPRLEVIRHQLATEKLDQAAGRARFPIWTETTTLILTDAPIGNITKRADLFTSAAFNQAEAPSALGTATEQIAQAEANGDTKAYVEATGQSERNASRKTKPARDQQNAERDAEIIRLHRDGKSNRKIAAILTEAGIKNASEGTIRRVVNDYKKQLRHNGQRQLEYIIDNVRSDAATENTDPPCLDRQTALNMYTAGASLDEIASALDLEAEHVREILDTQAF